MDLVPIKVHIGLKNNGHAKYPNFNGLASVKATGLDWSQYVDVHGSGWLYDTCGHKEEETGSPLGCQLGMLLVPEAFANEASAEFSTVDILTETEAEDFYEDNHGKHFDEEDLDKDVLQAIKTKQDMSIPLTAQQNSALNPNSETPGVRKNYRKKWTDFKEKKAFVTT